MKAKIDKDKTVIMHEIQVTTAKITIFMLIVVSCYKNPFDHII